ncbi:MAG TPA: 50S ribosomal protein L1 [Candidatus Hydrogenedentes bacterium]|nr:50S ribosomal protein L1 [Candidatus Hydrogenedentota bacterium]
MPKHSKRVNAVREKVDHNRYYTVEECANLIKECATAKFDETVELAFLLGVDPRHADQMVRGSVSLPHGTGKSMRVVVFCDQEEQIKAATDAGAEEVGGEELANKIQGGWTDFDAAVATPAMMRVVGKLGKVLGPRGLMPSPKAGTVTNDVGQAVAEIKAGKIEFRVDKNANIHVPVGKVSFTAEQIKENAERVIETIVKARPAACKGTYLKSCAISSTMGPGLKLDAAALMAQYR